MTFKALCHSHYGPAHEVVRYRDVPFPTLGPKELRLNIAYAPINPADINMCEGKYYTQPPLPSALGNEGVGIVTEMGGAVDDFELGDHVIIPFKDKENWAGLWASELIVSHHDCLKVPKSIPLQQAAMLTINPPTALLMLKNSKLSKGEVVVQNAANSAVGLWVNYFAKKMGLELINLVRSARAKAQLQALGINNILIDQDGVASQIKESVGPASLAINGVGGKSVSRLCRSLHPGGKVITYGAMSKEPLTLSNGVLIYKNISFEGFNRTRWVETKKPERVRKLYQEIFDLLAKDPFSIPIHQEFSLAGAKEALIVAQQPGRKGKVLFRG